MQLTAVVVVDIVSALAMLVVAGFFFRLWRTSRASLHLLFAVAFATLAAGISTVGTSEFDVSGSNTVIDAIRIVAHTAAPLMLVMGYLTAWRGTKASPVRIIPLAFAIPLVIAALLIAVPPQGSVSAGSTRNAFVAAHAIQFLLYLALVVLSARTFLRTPTMRRALVPLAFLAYSFSKYSWIFIDVSGDTRLVGFVYLWRFTMLGLMLAVLLAPFLKEGQDAAP